jgi:hypothetical protein
VSCTEFLNLIFYFSENKVTELRCAFSEISGYRPRVFSLVDESERISWDPRVISSGFCADQWNLRSYRAPFQH